MSFKHPNRLQNPVNVSEQERVAPRQYVIVLSPEQYALIEKRFPIDRAGDFAFQLGVQAVLRVLRDGFTSGV